MPRHLDCVMMALDQNDWLLAMTRVRTIRRLSLHRLPQEYSTPTAMLRDPAVIRGRYDAILAYIDEVNLSAWRVALANQASHLSAIVIVYAVDLRAQAIRDLLVLGAADFMYPPFSAEELRARVEHKLARVSAALIAEDPGAGGAPGVRMRPLVANERPWSEYPLVPSISHDLVSEDMEQLLCQSVLGRSASAVEAYAIAAATQRSARRRPYQVVKKDVVARFEQAYIRATLGRYGGNITRAAEAAQKHRRAFWALMRKHEIDPSPYRTDYPGAG